MRRQRGVACGRCYGKFNLDTLYTKWGISADKCNPDTPGSTCAPSSTAREGNLAGTHLDIVTVDQPGFTNMHDATGALLPPTQWTGYFPDLISWIANQSGMTYTLYAPTTGGSGCESATAGNYGCGQKDVTELGLRDMYMGLYYVTPSRLEAGLMTRSFTGDAGTLASAPHVCVPAPQRVLLQAWRSQLT